MPAFFVQMKGQNKKRSACPGALQTMHKWKMYSDSQKTAQRPPHPHLQRFFCHRPSKLTSFGMDICIREYGKQREVG